MSDSYRRQCQSGVYQRLQRRSVLHSCVFTCVRPILNGLSIVVYRHNVIVISEPDVYCCAEKAAILIPDEQKRSSSKRKFSAKNVQDAHAARM